MSHNSSDSSAQDFLQCAYPRQSQNEVKQDPAWTEGDFELVSADGVRFRVPSYYMYASS